MRCTTRNDQGVIPAGKYSKAKPLKNIGKNFIGRKAQP
jgi:hypothetical protein